MSPELAILSNNPVKELNRYKDIYENRLTVWNNFVSLAKSIDEEVYHSSQIDIDRFNELLDMAVDLDAQGAQKVYRMFHETYEGVVRIFDGFLSMPLLRELMRKETIENIKKLRDLIDRLDKTLQVISEGEAVDEESKDYKKFVKKLMDERKPDKVGKSAKELFVG